MIPVLPAIIPGVDNRVTQLQTCQTTTANGVDVVNCSTDLLWDRLEPVVMTLITVLAVVLLIWAGIQYIMAQGNAEKTKQARQRIIHIVVAIMLLVAAYAVINLIIAGASLVAGWGAKK